MPEYTNPIINLIIVMLLATVYVLPVLTKRGAIYRANNNNNVYSFIFAYALISLFCTFAFSNGDFFNYYDAFERILLYGENSHLEPIYVWVVSNVTNDYITWRFLVWGTTTLILLLSFKRLRLPQTTSYAAITLCYLTTLYIMRGNLGNAIMLYGLTLIYRPIHRFEKRSYIIGIVLLIVSYFFHKSMILALALIVPAWFINFNRKKMLISFAVFPVAVIVMRILLNYMSDFGLGGDIGDNQVNDYAKRYAQHEHHETNSNGMIAAFFTYFGTYFMVYYSYSTRLVEKLPSIYRLMFNYWYIWVYMASIFIFQEIGGWYFSRFLYTSNLPMAIVVAYMLTNYRMSFRLKVFTIMSFAGTLYPILYAIYKYKPV